MAAARASTQLEAQINRHLETHWGKSCGFHETRQVWSEQKLQMGAMIGTLLPSRFLSQHCTMGSCTEMTALEEMVFVEISGCITAWAEWVWCDRVVPQWVSKQACIEEALVHSMERWWWVNSRELEGRVVSSDVMNHTRE